MSNESDIKVQTVQKLQLKQGDILYIQVGGMLQPDLPIWIPGEAELAYARDDWEAVVPEGVQVIVGICLHEPTIIRPNAEVAKWQDEVQPSVDQ